ncbi:MAG: hypothetical protein KBT68_08840 [bacterium]|nr:hypothetical protein [Candidatus Colisoma equi]
MIKHQMFIAMALFVGVAIGYFVKDEPVAADEPAAEEIAKKPVADKGEAASVKALRHRIAELEKALAEKDGKSEIAISNAVAEAMKNRPPEPPRGNWRERMEEMRKNDPERYTQMTNRFSNWRRSQAERARNKIDFLSSIDISHMSAKAQKTHEDLQDLIARREEIEQQLQDPNLSDEDRGKLMRQLWESHGELQRLNGEERKNLIRETARSIGFEGEDAKEFSATIREVIEATDSGWDGRRHHGGPRGPGGHGGR